MPEVIDGVSYPTTPVIPASPNTPAGGNRPYPTGASPGKAMWQLLKRAMEELDKFESTAIRTLTDRVVAAEAAVSSTSLQRRLFTKTSSQSMTAAASTVLFQPDTNWGDDASKNQGITYNTSTGVFTLTQAGLYEFTLSGLNTGSNIYIGFRVNGTMAQHWNYLVGSDQSLMNYPRQVKVQLPANSTMDVRASSASAFTLNASATLNNDSTTGGTLMRTSLSIVRLSA